LGLAWGIGYQVFFSHLGDSLSTGKAQLFFWGLFIFSWLGAKVLFIINTQSNTLFFIDKNFWLGGGLVYYGGLIGGFFYYILFKYLHRDINFQKIWPIFPALTAGHGIGRIGCFLAGCCYGKKTNWIWGIYQHGEFRHPTQLIEGIGLILFSIYFIKDKGKKTHLFSLYAVSYGILRILIELLRGDQERGIWWILPPSVWLSVILICLGVGYNLINNSKMLRNLKEKT
jgi:phosphatidylglycerol:prolipoprotein diacylglycerol transferase